MTVLRQSAQAGQTVLVTVHDLSLAARFCDRLVLLAAGEIIADGPPDAVLTPAHLAACFGVEAALGPNRTVQISGLA
jgi:iron complex transport system ATP-binding protein